MVKLQPCFTQKINTKVAPHVGENNSNSAMLEAQSDNFLMAYTMFLRGVLIKKTKHYMFVLLLCELMRRPLTRKEDLLVDAIAHHRV